MKLKQITRASCHLALAAFLVALSSAHTASAEGPTDSITKTGKTIPEQAWAHQYKKIHLLPNGATSTNSDTFDRMLIQEAFARYGIAYDEVRLDVLASLFTEDAVVEVTEGPKTLNVNTGREAILKNFSSALSQQGDQRRHAVTNLVFEKLTKTEASVLAYGIVTVAANGLSLGATVIYSADFRRGNDGLWRFSRLLIGMDTYSGNKPVIPVSR